MSKAIFIGFDPREQDAFNVCVASIKRHTKEPVPIIAVSMPGLVDLGLYQRPTERRGGQLWDIISDAPMSTEFAISRFAVPILAREAGFDLALFCDCDFMFRADIEDLFAESDPVFAVSVVKHEQPSGDAIKMDGQAQTSYERKNWSSLCLYEVMHPANRQLTPAKLNSWSGRALHQFKWLEDSEIGDLSPDWNHLVGVDPVNPSARGVHHTLGVPSMAGYENSEHADEWRELLSSAR